MKLLIKALISHVYAIKSGHNPTIFTCNQLIYLYSKHGFIKDAYKLFDEMPERNIFTWNTIISAQINSQNLTRAEILFDASPYKDSVTYNSILSGYVSNEGYETKAVDLFMKMHLVGDEVPIDEFTLTRMCNLTAKIGDSCFGKQLHSFMVKTGCNLSGFAVSSLVDMYSKTGCFNEAYNTFNESDRGFIDVVSKNAFVAACCREGKLEMGMKIFSSYPELNDMVSWNTIITGNTQNGFHKEAIELAFCMTKNGFKWNEHTFAGVLNSCSGFKCLKLGKELHCKLLKEFTSLNPFISSGIVDVYCKCGNMTYAELVYLSFGGENIFSATSMIVGYSSQGNMKKARMIFDSLTEKNRVVWTAMFSGYVNCKFCEKVIELFHLFKNEEKTVHDGLILSSLLGAFAIQATVGPGKEVHCYLFRANVFIDGKLIASLIDMYSKCGNITYAKRVFEGVKFRDLVIYNIMIAGFAHHGCETDAFSLFDKMVKSGFIPDNVTFIAMLSACRHSGLIKSGEKYFKMMTEMYNITPEIDHYSCMIDLYGRGDKLITTMEFMKSLPIEELDVVILGTLLSACRIHGNVLLAREIEENLVRIGRKSGTRYVQLANVYASDGKWDEMGRIRKEMRGNDVSKNVGCSWVHIGSKVHSFTSSDKYFLEAGCVYGVLDFLIMEMNNREEIEIFC